MTVAAFHAEAAAHLAHLERLLVPGAKLTLVVRFAGEPERDIVISNDHDYDELIAVMQREQVSRGGDAWLILLSW